MFIEEAGIQNVFTELEGRRLKLFGHIKRMDKKKDKAKDIRINITGKRFM